MSKSFLNIYGTFHGRNHSNTSVQCVTKYEVNYDSNGNYNIGSIVSKEELNSATKLSDLIKNGTVVAYEISQGKIIGYCYQSTKLWLGIR